MGLVGEVPTLIYSTRFFVLSFKIVNNCTWPEAVAFLIAIHPMIEEEGKDKHIAMVLNEMLCHHACYLHAND
jgi:hypothetical protein